jgi:hypothetical protein
MKDHQEEWQKLCAQAAVEQDSAKLMKLIQRITELLDAKQKRLQGNPDPASSPKLIFQIAYDEVLLIEREQLLKQRGYDVISVLGNADAQRSLARIPSCRLFIVGHNAPSETREEMVRWLRAKFPHAKIVALNSPSHRLPEADFNFVLNGPEEWLAAVASTAS